jgi:hypothetical protein
MNAVNGGNAGQKKIDYHLKPKILGKDFTTSELRTWCSGMAFFWAAQDMENKEKLGSDGPTSMTVCTALKRTTLSRGCRSASGSATHAT